MRCPRNVVVASAMVAPCALSTAVWCGIAALVPSGRGVAGVLVPLGVTWLAGRRVAERGAAGVLEGARDLSEAEQAVLAAAVTLACRVGHGPPVVALRAAPGPAGVLPAGAGRRTVLVPVALLAGVHHGRVTPRQAAAGIVHAAAITRAGLTRQRMGLQVWCLPWTVLAGAVAGARRRLPLAPVALLLWRARGVVVAVAAVQAVQAGHLCVSALTVATGAGSYLVPRAARAAQHRVQEVGDAAVRDAGLGLDYIRLLEIDGCALGMERRVRLTPA